MSDIKQNQVETRSFSLPTFEEFEPASLAKLFVDLRDFRKVSIPHDRNYPEFTAKGIESLFRACYRASMLLDEGRLPNFQTIMINKCSGEPTMRFRKKVLVDEAFLRSYSQAVPMDSAILVSELDGTVYADGVAPNQWKELFMGQHREFHPALCIKVDGPGDLTIAMDQVHCRVRPSFTQFESEIGTTPLYRKWLNELTGWVGTQLKHPIENGYFEAFQKGVVSDHRIEQLWKKVLEHAQSLRHGGSFVICPTDNPVGIELTYFADSLALGADLVRCYNARSCAGQFLDRVYVEQIHRDIVATAQVSAMDGCVVLDRQLRLIGFGGKIQVNDCQHIRSLVDQNGNPLCESETMLRKGLRHKSAYNLCKAHANYLAFVVSQDGLVTLFCSDDRNVYMSNFPDFPQSLNFW